MKIDSVGKYFLQGLMVICVINAGASKDTDCPKTAPPRYFVQKNSNCGNYSSGAICNFICQPGRQLTSGGRNLKLTCGKKKNPVKPGLVWGSNDNECAVSIPESRIAESDTNSSVSSESSTTATTTTTTNITTIITPASTAQKPETTIRSPLTLKSKCEMTSKTMESKNIDQHRSRSCLNTDNEKDCTVYCKQNYSISTDIQQTMTCRNGNWTTDVPQCKQIQCKSMERRNYTRACKGKFIGDSCSIQCKKGFKFPRNTTSEITTCILNDDNSGEWSPAIEDCQEVSCQKFTPKMNQEASSCAENSINSSCAVRCAENHKFSGTSEMNQESFCKLSSDKLSASWSSVPNCEKIQCKSMARRNYTSGCKERFIGDSCSIQCKKGFKFPSNTTRKTATCILNDANGGVWSPAFKNCQEIKCGKFSPKNDQKASRCTKNSINSSCTVTCAWKKYKFSGTSEVEQQSFCKLSSDELSASWSNLPVCEKQKCRDLQSRTELNLIGTCDPLAVDENCTLQCKRNHYARDGETNVTVICQFVESSQWGSWTNIQECKKIPCKELKSQRYKSRCEKKFVGDYCSVQCSRGYKFSNKTTIRTECILDEANKGKWSLAIEDCQKIKCTRILLGKNQESSSCKRQAVVGSECNVKCGPKYVVSGTATNTQRSVCNLSTDGLSASWSHVSDCEKITCGELQGVDKHNLNGTCGPLTVDETCTLPCKLHHKLPTGEINVTITCSLNSKLSASYKGIKNCTKIRCAEINPGNYTHDCHKKFIGDSCSIQCEPESKFPSNKTKMSTECVLDGATDGKWSPAIGNCLKVTCKSTSSEDFGNPSEHGEHRLTPVNNCKTGQTCTVKCPEGYQFSTNEANRTLTCDIMSENWTPSPQSVGLCRPIVHAVEKCQYWFSGIKKNKTEARIACIDVLDEAATLAMPKTVKPLQKFLTHNFYLVGGSLRKDGYRWDDGTKINEVVSANKAEYVAISKNSGSLTSIRPKQGWFFVCEKSIRGYSPCSSKNACGSLGKCVSYGCSYRCECPDLVYGPRCEHGPFSVNITNLRITSFRVSVRNYADNVSALFRVFKNGRPVKNYTLEPKTELNETVKIPPIKFNSYISVKASLIGRPKVTQSICRLIKPNKGISLAEIWNDDCNGTVLDIFWKGLWNESDDTTPYKVYLNETSHGSSQAGKKFRIKGLDPRRQYKIKVVPVIAGCSYDDNPSLFESEIKRTSVGPPGEATLNMPNTTGGNCSIAWELRRWTAVKTFQINITESVRFKSKDSNLSSNDRVIQVNTSKNHTFKTNPNSLYRVSVGTMPTQECRNVKIKWSNLAIGCRTDVSAPKPITKSPEISEAGNRRNIKLQAVDERNGEVSCYLIIIHKMNTSVDTSEIVDDTSRLKQANETVMVGDYYVASATKRFTGEITVALGDGKFSCCNIKNNSKTCDLDSKAKVRRATTTDVVTASNNPLEPGTTYRHYVLITTPRGNGLEPFYTASPFSEPWINQEDPGVLSTNFAAIILPVIIGIVSVIIILGVLIYRRRKEKSIPRNGVGSRLDPDNHSLLGEPHAYVELSENPESIIGRELAQFSMQLPRLYEIMNEKRENEDMQFLEEFKKDITNSLRKCTLTCDIARLRMNQPKNRYKNIIPYDRARVVLGSISGVEFSDYINASYIDGYSYPRKFIAAQGPKPETTSDFWRMVLEQDCRVIAMLTRTKEKHKVKCAQYWPMEDGDTQNYGNIAVQLLATLSYGEFIKSELQVTRGSEVIQVSHFQFIAWPDHGIPITTSSILRFHQYVTSEQPDASGPIVVHCSAGVGRTGTLIALDHLRNEIVHTDEINIAAIIGKMRTKRPEMVQTLEQYIFIHKLVLELYQFGYTDLNVSNFNSSYTELKRGNADGRSFEAEFAMLDYFLPLNTKQFSAEKEQNKHLNRYPAILPYDHNAVFIQMNASDKSVPYYNASFVASYSPGNQFIAAQNPDEASFELFWRVVLDNNVNTIVGLFEEGESDHHCYWPHKTTESNYDSVNVRIKSTQQEAALTERTLEVSCNGKEIEVKHLVYNAWPEQSTPSSSSTVLDIISKIEKHHQTLVKSESKNTLVHCSDGAGRTGTFCAISNLIERLKSENSVDVFRTVKDLRDQRPMMVHTLAQYQFCYQSISEFLQLFDLYGNFQ